MKNNQTVTSYLSTTQAAQRLGLSVGTIQRMVEAGVLQAYTTQGGHRRILSSSLNHYCRGTAGAPEGPGLLCVLASNAEAAPLASLGQIPGLQLITNPLELAGIHSKVDVLFMDARIPWLPWEDLHIADSLGTEAHCIIYNSVHLPEHSRTGLQSQASLYPGDVSSELIQGYLLGHASATKSGTGACTSTCPAQVWPSSSRPPAHHDLTL